ncbi:MAG TPA: cytochrome b/b6 domain-containing protein [Casimicrobiaceae bacterium]|nr:cytochrome b/b6 domain-containing protein [Casimicrobiaceae bacterium]
MSLTPGPSPGGRGVVSPLYYRHTLPVRIMHWVNVLALAILFMSGLNIFSAHPALNWGKSSYDGRPPALEIGATEDAAGEVVGITRVFGHDFVTTGWLGASKGADGEVMPTAFPSWLMIPDYRWLAMARRWHLFFAWVFVVNGLCYLAYSIASRHLSRDLAPTSTDLRSTGQSIVDHLRFKHPTGEAAKRYNVLQKIAYLVVIFVLLPLVVMMGMAMSPWLDSLLPGWVDIFGGRQSARTIHFIVAWLLVLFVLIHVFEVIISGFWNHMRSMITGRFRIDHGASDGAKK